MNVSTNRLPRLSLAFSALLLGAGGVVHALSFPKAGAVAAHGLNMFYAAAFNGLWLSDSATSIVLALAFASLALRPQWAATQLVAILSFAPIGSAIAIYWTMGMFFAGHLMLAAGVAALLGARGCKSG